MARTEYVEELLLKVKSDRTDLDDIQKQIDSLKITKLFSPAAMKELEKFEKENNERIDKLNEIEKEITKLKEMGDEASKDMLDDLISQYQELNDEIKSASEKITKKAQQKSIADVLNEGVKKGLIDAGEKAWKGIKDLAVSFFEEAKDMMRDIAAYSEDSTVFSSEATQLKLTYGLSGAEAYAAQKASEDTQFGSFDDFVQNQAFAEEGAKKRWQELFQKYQQTYEQDKEIALEFQKFETEWIDFKKEMSMELINFFMENKDTIKFVFKTLITFMEVGLKAFSWIIKHFSQDVERTQSERDESTKSILEKYAVTESNVNNTSNISETLNNQIVNNTYNTNNPSQTNVSVSNTFNSVQTSDRQELINAGNLTFEQVMKALGG